MKSRLLAAALACGAFAIGLGPAAGAETLKGQTVIASYNAPGLCAQTNRSTGLLSLQVCAQKSDQEFHMETFNDIAQQVSWQKIMSGKDCLQAWFFQGERLYTERCSITTWSKGAFWSISSSGDMYSQEEYCAYRQDDGVAPGTALVAQKCRWFAGVELYPAVLTKTARVGPKVLASYTGGQAVDAIVIDNGFSGGNLVASKGAKLTIDRSGKVSATKGGYIIAGGAGYRIQQLLADDAAAVVVTASDFAPAQPDDLAPKDLEFFKLKQRGKISYDLR